MAQAENTRRWIVRTALVTSSTIATLVGAQMLITVDQTANAAQPQTAVVQTSANTTITHAAPNIVVVRQSGGSSVAEVPTPAPAQITQLPQQQFQFQQPSIIQFPARSFSRSTR